MRMLKIVWMLNLFFWMLISPLVCHIYYLIPICCFAFVILIKYKGDAAKFYNLNSLTVGCVVFISI
jgi:hypothetical protein